jgi:bifunctional DNA-binding transcriptional regulator/antitoxin component of YhaV-PrlF toxin-antitoxin module
MKVADEVWTSVALLHQENPDRTDFSVGEIKARARLENWLIRQGFNVHVSYHCLANKPANPANHRMLYEDSRGRKRLYRSGDPFHPEREHGKVRPDKRDIPAKYENLVDWYDAVYSQQPPPTATALAAARMSSAPSPESHSAKSRPQSTSRTAFVSSAGAFVIPDTLREELGIQAGTRLSVYREQGRLVMQPVTEEYISSLRGCCKGEDSLVEALEHERRHEK